MECEYCLHTSEDVRETFDPYAWEMHGELKDIIACDGCLDELAADI